MQNYFNIINDRNELKLLYDSIDDSKDPVWIQCDNCDKF